MASIKPRIVIIGAGLAGLTAANKLYTSTKSKQLFDLLMVEGGTRIGGRINSSELCGDRIEQGATWIHGIEGSPIYKIAQETSSLHSKQPWECMDGFPEHSVTVAEGGHELNPSIVNPISTLFKNLMDFTQRKSINDADGVNSEILKHCASNGASSGENLSVGTFLRRGLEAYWGFVKYDKGIEGVGNWSRMSLEEAIFTMHENTQKSIDAAHDLGELDYKGEREYMVFPGDDITIAKGYSRVIESLASVLPSGMIQLGCKVDRIQWQNEGHHPVKLYFSDGSTISADHVIFTASLGVLKQGISQDCGLFDPPLPSSKTRAISRLGYGVVDKVFLQLPADDSFKFPLLQMVFHEPDSELRDPKIPSWIRRTSLLYPIYKNSRVVVSWFTGREALEMESLREEEIADGFSATVSNLLSSKVSNNSGEMTKQLKFGKVLRSQWGTDPLFLGSYSYVAVGSSGDDIDTLAEPLPEKGNLDSPPQLQILFAGEATHRTHYSSTHGAYLSGLREANRILEHYAGAAL